MNSNWCYEKLNFKLSADNPLLTEYKEFKYDHVPSVPGNLYDSKDTFKQCNVPMHYFKNEPILEIMKKYNFAPKIFFIDAGYIYNWHRDYLRDVTINLTLSDSSDYLVAFSQNYPDENDDRILRLPRFMYKPFTRLNYEPRYYYVFNTQIPHISINYSDTGRHVLTISKFQKTPVVNPASIDLKEVYYFKFVEELKNQNLIE